MCTACSFFQIQAPAFQRPGSGVSCGSAWSIVMGCKALLHPIERKPNYGDFKVHFTQWAVGRIRMATQEFLLFHWRLFQAVSACCTDTQVIPGHLQPRSWCHQLQKGDSPKKTRKGIPTAVQFSSSHSGGGRRCSALRFTFSSRDGRLCSLIREENQDAATSHPPGSIPTTRSARRKEALCVSSAHRLQSTDVYLSWLFLYGGRVKPACFTHWAIQPPT